MKIPSREQIEELRRIYPVGATVELIDMDDCQAPRQEHWEKFSAWMLWGLFW